MKIKATALLRANDESQLYFQQFSKDYYRCENDLPLIFTQVQNTNPQKDERQTLQTTAGQWYFKLNEKRYIFAALTIPQYPERQVFAMLNEMENEISKIPNYEAMQPKTITTYCKTFMKGIQAKYDNVEAIDKIARAEGQLQATQQILGQGITKMLENTAMVNNMEMKTEVMKTEAQKFQKNAADLERIMYWRNMKLKIIVVLIVLSIILYITIPLIIQAQASK